MAHNPKITLQVWRAAGLPAPVAEHGFHPTRKWRFDYAWPEQLVAVEVQGGLFTRGRHTRGPALRKEYEKLREAAACGWLVLPVPPDEVTSKDFLRQLRQALD